jgi:hypothetical protein
MEIYPEENGAKGQEKNLFPPPKCQRIFLVEEEDIFRWQLKKSDISPPWKWSDEMGWQQDNCQKLCNKYQHLETPVLVRSP